ncbi:MAG: thymidylate synthase, partial [Steroidobacter sp.]
MYFVEDSLDDLLRVIFPAIIQHGQKVSASRGPCLEVRGALLVLKNPLARLSRSEAKGTIFSCLGELLWYLAGSNDLGFIEHYIGRYREDSDDGKTIYGAYGPRFFDMRSLGIDQIANVVKLLREKPTSRRAVIQLYDAEA